MQTLLVSIVINYFNGYFNNFSTESTSESMVNILLFSIIKGHFKFQAITTAALYVNKLYTQGVCNKDKGCYSCIHMGGGA